MKSDEIAVVIPTYNERGNIVPLIGDLLALPLNIRVLVVDDDSPDGTAAAVRDAFSGRDAVSVYVRKEKRGRGWAGRFGFLEALRLGSGVIGEMDADFSHHPKFIPSMVRALDQADAVIGSRYTGGGDVERRSRSRKAVTMGARAYLKALLGIKVSDPTSGFRFFRREALAAIAPVLQAEDPFIVTEVLYRLTRNRARIVEVPIVFYERRAGESKLKAGTLLKYLWRVLELRWQCHCEERFAVTKQSRVASDEIAAVVDDTPSQ